MLLFDSRANSNRTDAQRTEPSFLVVFWKPIEKEEIFFKLSKRNQCRVDYIFSQGPVNQFNLFLLRLKIYMTAFFTTNFAQN